MAKQINIYNNKSFSELEWSPGELIMFENLGIGDDSRPPFLVIPRKIVKGFENNDNCIKFAYGFHNYGSKENEYWTLYPKGSVSNK